MHVTKFHKTNKKLRPKINPVLVIQGDFSPMFLKIDNPGKNYREILELNDDINQIYKTISTNYSTPELKNRHTSQ